MDETHSGNDCDNFSKPIDQHATRQSHFQDCATYEELSKRSLNSICVYPCQAHLCRSDTHHNILLLMHHLLHARTECSVSCTCYMHCLDKCASAFKQQPVNAETPVKLLTLHSSLCATHKLLMQKAGVAMPTQSVFCRWQIMLLIKLNLRDPTAELRGIQ